MIYTNLFKPKQAVKAKEDFKYNQLKKPYPIEDILPKRVKITSLTLAIGTIIIIASNIGSISFYNEILQMKEKKLSSISIDYDRCVQDMETQSVEQLSQKANIENIYNLSTKPIKWANVVNDISNQLPYDGILTKIETISNETLEKNLKEQLSSEDNQDELSEPTEDEENTEDADTSDEENTEDADTSDEENIEDEENTEDEEKPKTNLGKDNAFQRTNNIVSIEGYCYSLVNVSLFLDKLDTLDIFSKVEAVKVTENKEIQAMEFQIYAFLK